MKRVKIKWIDSQGTGTWIFSEDVNLKIEPCHSTGYVVKENKDIICITHTRHKKATGVMGYVMIPKCCIIKIKRCKKGK